MTSFQSLFLLTARVFVPVVALLAGLALVFVDLPLGFNAAVSALGGFAACLLVSERFGGVTAGPSRGGRRPLAARSGRRRLAPSA